MISYNKYFFFLLGMLLTVSFNYSKDIKIILDIEGLIVQENRTKTFWDIGPTKVLGFNFNFNPDKIAKEYFDHLGRLIPDTTLESIKNGLRLPQIIKNWLSNKEPLYVFNAHIPELSKKLHRAIARHMFDPNRYASVRECNREGLRIMGLINAYKHEIYILGNQNAESYAALCNNPDIRTAISLSKAAFISGQLHMIMPDPLLLKYALDHCNLKNDDIVIYISEEITFINAFRALGRTNVYCIHHTSYNNTIQELRRFNVVT